MAPRPRNSTSSRASSSVYTDDVQESIEPLELDDPAAMSPGAILAELRYYGVDVSQVSPIDRSTLQRALVEARRQRSKGGIGYQQSDPQALLPRNAPQHYNSSMNVIQPPNAGHNASRTNNKVASSLGSNPTFIPLLPGNRIPPQILNVVRTSADPSMRAINLDDRQLGDWEVIKLSKAMEDNRTVTSLSLRNCSITDVGVSRGLACMLRKNGTLAELLLDGNRIGTEGAASLGTALITNESLAVLSLSGNETLGDAGVAYLIGALEHNLTIRALDVSGCGPDADAKGRSAQIEGILDDRQIDANFESLLERLMDDDFHVTGIDLSGRRIGSGGAARLADALSDNTQVRQLWLRGCNVGDEGARALASCLEQNMSIVELYLARNAIGDDGLVAISDALTTSNSTLVSLELDGNDVGERGLRAFLRALETNTSVLMAGFENNPKLENDRSRMVDDLQDKLKEKIEGMNRAAFVVDPDAASQQDDASRGVVDLSICSSYMPSTYRRAGHTSVFTSVTGRPAYERRDSSSRRPSPEQHRSSTNDREHGAMPPTPPYPRQQQQQQQQQAQRPSSSPKEPSPVSEEAIRRVSPPPPSSTPKVSPPQPPSTAKSNAASAPPKSSVGSAPRWQQQQQRQQQQRSTTPKPEQGSQYTPRWSTASSSEWAGRHPVPATPAPASSPQRVARQRVPITPAAPSPPSVVYERAQVPIPEKARALQTIAERKNSGPTTQTNSSESKFDSKESNRSSRRSNSPRSRFQAKEDLSKKTNNGYQVINRPGTPPLPLVSGPKSSSKSSTPRSHTKTVVDSIKQPQTQRNFNTTLRRLMHQVELAKRANGIAARHYSSRHFLFWFVPISSCIFTSIVLVLTCALGVGDDARLGLALFSAFFSFVAFVLNFLQGKFGTMSRASLHRSARVEMIQVAFRLDKLGKYRGWGLTSGSHSTESCASAIRALHRIDVYVQAMRQCTPPIPKNIHEVCFLLVSRLKVICHKCPHAVKERLHYKEDDWADVSGDANVVPLGMQIDAFNLLEEELTAYFRYPMFMPNAQDVVSRTIDIFFADSGDSFSVGTRTVDSRSV